MYLSPPECSHPRPRYNFVTPLTSLVALKPEDKAELEKEVKADDDRAGDLTKIAELEMKLEETKAKLLKKDEDVDYSDYDEEYDYPEMIEYDGPEKLEVRGEAMFATHASRTTTTTYGYPYADPYPYP